MDLVALARAAVERHPAVRSVELVGSRARGDATDLSDWDFLVETRDLDPVAAAQPALVAVAEPLAAQWDRLSEEASYFMLVLSDGTKVDFVLRRPPQLEPPWKVTHETLRHIDAHFWDWILWLGGKQLRGNDALVELTLSRLMYEHLLAPLGATAPPATIAASVELYCSLRERREREFGVDVGRRLEAAVRQRLSRAGLL